MAAVRIHPLAAATDSELDSDHNGRFSRYSAWSLSPEHEETDTKDELPRRAELVDVPLKDRLMHYFEWLSINTSHDIKQSHLEQLLKDGADILMQHEHTGFSVVHYTAAQWDVSITEFLVSKGAKLDCTDKEGRTPLHLAAYSNHTDMIEYLLDNGGNPNCKTNIQQTPIHFAVRGDSVQALQLLVERGGLYRQFTAADYRGRTPLQLATELDRDKAVLFLLSIESSPARCSLIDKFGHPVLSSMISNMPQMAFIALNQFHRLYPADRHQDFRLHKLESSSHITKTPFEVVVENREYHVLVHPVMRKLIEQKWKHFARWYLILHFIIYIIFLLVWTTLFAYPSVQSKHQYNFPIDIWRVILWMVGIALLIEQMILEIFEYVLSQRRSKRFKTWLVTKLMDDINHCSNSSFFNDEKAYLENSLKETRKIKAQYFKDPWNFIDMVTFILLIVQVVLHIFDIAFHSQTLALWVARVGALGIILIWVRLLFYARATKFIGPMVAIMGQLSGNVAQYLIIISVIFIPYAVCFWVFFGGEQQTIANITEVSPELIYPHRVVVMLFRMTLVDSFPYKILRSIDELTNTILVISFLFLTAVISLNLFIALLSDTFQRVYDNAKANAEMQKAELILSLQDTASRRSIAKFLKYIQEKCSPLREYYDDEGELQDISLTKITHQIHKKVQDFSESEEIRENHLNELKGKVVTLEQHMSTIISQIEELKELVSTGDRTRVSPILGSMKTLHHNSDNNFAQRPPLFPLLQSRSHRDLTQRVSQRRPQPYATQKLYPAQATVYQGHRKVNRADTVINEGSDEDSENELTP